MSSFALVPSASFPAISAMSSGACAQVVTMATETVYTTEWTTTLLAANAESTWDAVYTIREVRTGNPADYRRPDFPPCFVETTVQCNVCAQGEEDLVITAPAAVKTDDNVTIEGDGVIASVLPVAGEDIPLPTDIIDLPEPIDDDEDFPVIPLPDVSAEIEDLPEASDAPFTLPTEIPDDLLSPDAGSEIPPGAAGSDEEDIVVPAADDEPDFISMPPTMPTDVPDELLRPETGNEIPPGAAASPEEEDDDFVEASASSVRQGLVFLCVPALVAALILA